MIVKKENLNFRSKKIAMIIAGQPGVGKTTLALSSPKPLLIDLDKGVDRVEAKYRSDTDQVSSYQELISDLNGDLSGYETIVIDTGGKLLEFLKPVVIKENPKNGQSDGTLSLKGYGAVKRKFNEFINFVRSKDKHLITIFHASEVALSDDITGLRIRIEGSSKDEVWDNMDLGGFIETKGNKRVIGFSNCDRYYAKGTHGVRGTYQIPDYNETGSNNFISVLWEMYYKNLEDEQADNNACESIVNKFASKVDTCKNCDDVNALYKEINEYKRHILTSKDESLAKLKTKIKELNLTYDKETKLFVNGNATK